MKRLLLAAMAVMLAPSAGLACGPDTDCLIGERTYRIQMPANPGDGPIGALVYAHGYGGSAKAAMRNKALRALADELGMALVATKSASKDWLIPGVPENPNEDGQKEFTYYDAVIDQLERDHNIDRSRLVATGFSAGGMMVWNLACHRGDSFAGFLPIAGTFWQPEPANCPGAPVHLIHIHGLSDKIVPLKGRKIGPTHQGSVPKVLDRTIRDGGFSDAAERDIGGLACQLRSNSAGKVLGFCTHPGGHSIKMDYLRSGLDMLREAGAL